MGCLLVLGVLLLSFLLGVVLGSLVVLANGGAAADEAARGLSRWLPPLLIVGVPVVILARVRWTSIVDW